MLTLKTLNTRRVVGSFLGDVDIVRVGFLQARACDLDKLRALLQLGDSRAAAVAHTAPDTAYKLENGVGYRPLIRHTTLNTFGNEFFRVALEVSVGGTLFHSGETSHAAVYLERTPLINFNIAGSLLTSREQRAEHYDVCSRSKRLDDIAGILDTAIRDYRNAVLSRCACAVIHRCDLRDTDARDNTRRADRSRSDTDLYRVSARPDKILSSRCGRYVARDNRSVGECVLYLIQCYHNVLGVPVRGVKNKYVRLCLDFNFIK